jgi:hypothetical protein
MTQRMRMTGVGVILLLAAASALASPAASPASGSAPGSTPGNATSNAKSTAAGASKNPAPSATKTAAKNPATPASGAAPRVKNVTVLMGSRVFADFQDLQTAPLGKEFRVGETDFSARVVEFVPDFAIDGKSHKVVTRSNVPRNPACRIIVKEKGVPKDTSWAFVNFPPHFSRKSVISFRVVKIEFFNAPTITVAPDTTSVPDSVTARKP